MSSLGAKLRVPAGVFEGQFQSSGRCPVAFLEAIILCMNSKNGDFSSYNIEEFLT